MTSAHPEYEFAILGAGALGSILGAHLARAGHSVVMLARGRRAQQIQSEGLRITGLSDLTIRVPTLTDHGELRGAGVLIVAMKTPGTEQALANLKQQRFEAALSIQNGPLKNELLARAFGSEPVLGALADTSGELRPGGEVLFTRNVNLFVGELSGQLSDRAQRIAGALDAAGVRASAVAGIESLEWSKFAAWVGLMALSVTTRALTWRYLTDPGSTRVLVRLVREVGLLMRSLDITLTDQAVLPVKTLCEDTEERAIATVTQIGREFQARAPEHRMSSLQDLEAGRPLEVHETLGYALERAAQNQVQMPLVEAFYNVIAALDRVK
jgi:2-dehydropantoate 2-reductase